MKGNYNLAVCDILGFSELVRSLPVDVLVDKAVSWFRKSLYHCIHKNGFPEHIPSLSSLQSQSRIGLAWFSDTILLYSRRDDRESLQDLITTVAWLLFETIISGRTKIRAGLAYGEAYIEPAESLFMGPAIVEAYELERSQQWAGAALSPGMASRIPEEIQRARYADWPVAQYDVPCKTGETLTRLAIDWTIGLHPGFELRWSKSHAEPPEEDEVKRPDVCAKWRNTKAFHDALCRQCRRF